MVVISTVLNQKSRSRNYTHALGNPSAPYYIILFSVSLLTGLGLLMVLSASAVKSFEQTGSTYSIFLKQLLFLTFALLFAYLAMHLKKSLWEKSARLALPLSVLFLILPRFPGLGRTINGNTAWIGVGSFTIQPSEFAKLGIIFFCSMQLRRIHSSEISQKPWKIIFACVPAVFVLLGLIMAGKDLGTALIVMGLAAGLLFVGGTPMKQLAIVSALGITTAVGFILSSSNRVSRFSAFIHPFDPSVYKLAGWQTAHSVMGLASGGIFGVGLGASRQKWANLTEANTDFIFSVIGEELGLIGTISVLLLYLALIYGIFRTAMATKDIYFRYATMGIGIWLLIQVTVNVGSDIGVLPVVGVTLPFISYGGSALIANFLAVGFVLNVLRRDPDVKASMTTRRGLDG